MAGLLGAATVNPLMARQFANARQNVTAPTSVMDERYPAWKKSQDQATQFLLAADLLGSAVPAGLLAAPAMKKGLLSMGETVAPKMENYMARQGLLQPINAYHASPYKFNAFDASKIGTGEGAQAYGHGTYLAEARDTAKEYLKLGHGKGNVTKIGGVPINDFYSQIENRAARLPVAQSQLEYEKLGMLENLMNNQTPSDVLKLADGMGYSKSSVDWFKKQVMPKYEGAAHLYTVDLPDPMIAKMLDWDKPLSQQAPEVQGVLKRRITSVEPTDKFDMGGNALLRDNRLGQYDKSRPYPWILEARSSNGTSAFGLSQKDVERMFGSKDVKDLTGEQVMSRLTEQNGGSAAASSYLNNLGIPGIRYLDGGSRGAGAGTSNFVVFPGNEQLVKILSRE